MVLSCGCADDTSDPTMEKSLGKGVELDLEEEVLNTTYKKVTPLFRNIEKENWEGVLLFLSSGKWSNSLLTSTNDHLRSPSAEIQAKTWVTSYDRRGEPEWSQLPLHAAISYLAPAIVIQKLLDLYPPAIKCKDNEGMLPIHLAFGFGAPDSVLAMLMNHYPEAAGEKGLGDRLPHECCELGPNKMRGQVFGTVTAEVRDTVQREIAAEWKGFAVSAQKSLEIKKPLDLEDKKLTEFILELMHDRKELLTIKEKERARKAAAAKAAAQAGKSKRGRKSKGRI